MIDVDIEAEDLERQAELLARFDQIAARNFAMAANQVLPWVVSGWKGEAPFAQGTYQGSIAGRIESVVGMEVKGVASTSVRRDGRFPYPAALEVSERYRLRGTGKRSKGAMRRMLRNLGPRILNRFYDALERTLRQLVVR